jgi:hypothetical protein
MEVLSKRETPLHSARLCDLLGGHSRLFEIAAQWFNLHHQKGTSALRLNR